MGSILYKVFFNPKSFIRCAIGFFDGCVKSMAKIAGMIFGEVGYRDFNFIVSKDSDLQKGQYVKVDHETYSWVLAKVGWIKRYNDLYSLNAITGANHKGEIEDSERSIAMANVIGYLDGKGMLQVPKVPFKPGDKVYEAEGAIIKKVLGLGTRAGVYLGLLDGQEELTSVYLNVNKLIQKHFCVLAKTGAGKSYTVGVLIEELIEKHIPIIIIDPHGEYSSLKNPNDNPVEIELMKKYKISPRGYGNIVEYTPYPHLNPQADRKLTLDFSKLRSGEIMSMLPTKLSDGQKGILLEAVKTAKTFGRYTFRDIMNIIQEHDSKSKWNLLTGLEVLRDSKIFEGRAVYPMELARKGLVSTINLRGVEPEIQEIVVTRIVTELFDARKRGKIPPLLLLIEEVHNFAPERGLGQSISSGIMRTVASEGRKFGLGLCVVSQRPARVDKNVLSQCNSQIILKVTNPNDLRAISQSIEGFSSDLEEDIKQLQPGIALVVGDVVEQPIFVDIRVKKSKHGGASIDLIKESKRRTTERMGIVKRIFSR